TADLCTSRPGKPRFYAGAEGPSRKPSKTNLSPGRVDRQLNAAQAISIRYAQEDEKRTCFNCGGTAAANAGFDQTTPRRSVVFGHTWVQSPRRLNDFRFQYAYSMYQIAPAGTRILTDVGNYSADGLSIQRIHLRFVLPTVS